MAGSISDVINSQTRVTGLSSGLDTDSLVKKLVTQEQTNVDKAKQNQQLTQWSQDAYRSIITSLQSFYSTYFDMLSPTNITSASSFNAFKTAYNGADTSSYVTVSANASAQAGDYMIRNVKMATSAQYTSTQRLSSATGGITGGAIDGANISTNINSTSDKIAVNFNGSSKIITLNDNPGNLTDLVSDLNSKLDTAFGAGNVKATLNAGNSSLVFTTKDGDTTSSLSIGSVDGAFSTLGLSGVNTYNKMSTSSTLASIKDNFNTKLVPGTSDSNGNDIKFTVNGKSFSFNSSQATLSSIMSAVNNDPDAGVVMTYDQLSDKIQVRATATGSATAIRISDTSGNLMASLGLDSANVTGKDATMELSTDNGATYQQVTRSSNTFTINNLTYTLTGNTTDSTPIDAKVSTDSSKIVNLITGFVNQYNTIISNINTQMSDTRDTDYMPLTDDQKAAMTDTQVTQWEDKAKVGLLHNDSILGSMIDNLRTAMYSSVSGISASLSSIGITTGDYTDKGKLNIDTNKLTQAINSNPQQVIQLFTQNSQYNYGDTVSNPSERATRNAQEGIAWKISDILNDNIRTMKYGSTQKGALLEKAGAVGDTSEYSNLLSSELTEDADDITDLETKLSDKETYWYNKFTAMETAISQMNSQSSYISQMFSSSSSSSS